MVTVKRPAKRGMFTVDIIENEGMKVLYSEPKKSIIGPLNFERLEDINFDSL